MKLRPVMVETCEMNSRMSAFFRLIFHVSSAADADNSSVDKATRRHHLTLTMGERYTQLDEFTGSREATVWERSKKTARSLLDSSTAC